MIAHQSGAWCLGHSPRMLPLFGCDGVWGPQPRMFAPNETHARLEIVSNLKLRKHTCVRLCSCCADCSRMSVAVECTYDISGSSCADCSRLSAAVECTFDILVMCVLWQYLVPCIGFARFLWWYLVLCIGFARYSLTHKASCFPANLVRIRFVGII